VAILKLSHLRLNPPQELIVGERRVIERPQLIRPLLQIDIAQLSKRIVIADPTIDFID
jgi:hypothetical protein